MGFDGMGGTQYMDDGVNCSVAHYSDINSVVEKTHGVISCQKTAMRLASSAADTALDYDFPRFKESWRPILLDFISQRIR
jgi:hypothetical protein